MIRLVRCTAYALTITLGAIIATPYGRAMIQAVGYSLTTDNSTIVHILPTGSMEPNITHRNILVVKKKAIADIQIGDIIAYRVEKKYEQYCPSPYVVHRVITKNKDAITTQGDALSAPDPWNVYDNQIVGVMVASSSF